MASAQVLPNSAASSRKLEHLEAGKRKLEEFRKKKAAGRAKNSASSTHLSTANVDQHDKQPLDNQIVRLTQSNGAGSSDGASETVVEPSHVFIDDENKVNDFVQNNELGSYDTNAKPTLKANYYNEYSAETVHTPAKDQEFDRYNLLQTAGMVNVNYSPQPQEKNDVFSFSTGASGRHTFATDQSVAFRPQRFWEIDGNSSHPSPYRLEEAYSKENDSNAKDLMVLNPATSHVAAGNVSPENSSSFLLQNKFGYTSPQTVGQISSYKDSFHPPTEIRSSFDVGRDMLSVLESNNSMTSDMGERKLNNSVGHNLSGNSSPFWPSESRSTSFSYDARSSSDHVPLYPSVAETNARRSRPSFLDSITIPKVSHTEPGMVPLFSSKVQETDAVPSSAFEKSFTRTETIQPFSNSRASNVTSAFENSMASAVSAGNGDDMYRHTINDNNLERKHDTYSQKQDEDFAALEQHIEDLTQEKFSLQRALEASRALAESLATENSSLTDSYNQQGSVVNQLKIDMEKLQEDIKVHLVELESVKMEYANAQLECIAADERSKLLASEVIGLEEKALRLRSSELKLERQLDNSQAEISSFKKKISSLEKERQDFQSTIDALQEEKKMLQAKLRKVSSNGKFIDSGKNSNKKDASTSTGDLIPEDNTDSTTDNSNLEMHNTAPLLGTDASSSSLLPESRQFNLEVSSLNIPPDQIRTIQNIHTLISELALEKEELMQALLAESSEFSNLKELNNELSQKLEFQTQRLELLTAQSMANENIPTRPPDPHSMPDSAPYADEGDEVVERVLGWIMKLFPGGPSRRRTSKLL